MDHFSWAWAFLLNVPNGVALLIFCMMRLPESRGGGNAAVDATAATLATLGLAGVVFVMSVCAGLALLSAPSAWLMIDSRAAAYSPSR